MELCVVTHTSVTDFMALTWRQVLMFRDAYIAVMKAKKEAESG